MTYSKLINGSTPIMNKCNPRTSKIRKITPHHMAGNMSASACAAYHRDCNRQASANYYIGTDGSIWGGVPEEFRAWTSSSWNNDNQAITIEVANSSTGGNWPISAPAFNSLVRLCKDICQRYDIKLKWTGNTNGTLTCHDMFASTNCPGPYLKGKFPELVRLVTNTPAANKPDQILEVGSMVTSGPMAITGYKVLDGIECVNVPALGGHFPLKYLSEYDASDGKKDNYIASTKAKVYLDTCRVEKIELPSKKYKNGRAWLHGIPVDCTPLIEV